MSRISALALLAVASLSSACVITPLDNTGLSNKSSPVNVSGYGGQGSDTVTLQARYGSAWYNISTTTTASTSSTATGYALYSYSFPSTVVPSWAWTLECGYEAAELRVMEGTNALGTFDAAGWDCLVDEIDGGATWSAAGSECYTGQSFHVTVPADPC